MVARALKMLGHVPPWADVALRCLGVGRERASAAQRATAG
jgi:hypothetical protein